MDMKNIVVAAVVAFVVAFGVSLVGDNQPSVGSGSRFPSGISADGTAPTTGEVRGTSLQLDNGSATTSLIADKVCMTVTDDSGSSYYAFFSGATGDWATTSTSCL